MQPHWDDDDLLLAELAAAVHGTRDVAETVAAQGIGAFAWRTIDEDLVLAEVSFDSSLAPAGTHRGDPVDVRTVVFTAVPLSVEIEVGATGVLGQIVPPGPGRVQIEAADGDVLRATADELGFFWVPRPLPDGPIRLRCETPTGRLVTDWVRA